MTKQVNPSPYSAFDVTMIMTESLSSGVILCVWRSEASPAGAPWSG